MNADREVRGAPAMSGIKPDAFRMLPYPFLPPTDGRAAPLPSYYCHDDKEWYLFLPVDGALGRVAGGRAVFGNCWAVEPEQPDSDLPFALGTLVYQHLSFPRLMGYYNPLERDIHNLAATLEKMRVVSRRPKAQRDHSTLLVATELEYLIILVRSAYDLLQKLAKCLGGMVVFLDGTGRKALKNLPDSFAGMVEVGDRARTTEEIAQKWVLPQALAKFYGAEADFFLVLKKLRDGIGHHGRSFDPLFDLTEGIAVNVKDQTWATLPIWRPEHLRNSSLGPVQAVFAYLAWRTIGMTTRFTEVIRTAITLPQAVAPGLTLFLRGPFGCHLVNLERTLESPWEREGWHD